MCPGLKSLTSFKLLATTCNRLCKRTQHVTPNNVGSCWSKIGILSKDNGNDNKNVTPKYNLVLSQVFHDYLVLFTLYNTGELSCNWMGTNGFKVKIGNDRLFVKAWPNARNTSTQHHAKLLGTTCCVRLANLLRYVACVWPVHSTHVATSCNNVARCCVEMLRTFGQAFICSRCRQNLKFADFTFYFVEYGEEMHGKSCCTRSTILFPFLTNNILALWRRRCRSLKLPTLRPYSKSFGMGSVYEHSKNKLAMNVADVWKEN